MFVGVRRGSHANTECAQAARNHRSPAAPCPKDCDRAHNSKLAVKNDVFQLNRATMIVLRNSFKDAWSLACQCVLAKISLVGRRSAELGSTGCQLVVVGCLPTKLPQDAFRQAAKKDSWQPALPKESLNARATSAVVASVFYRPAFRFNLR